jgi:hypothetical protein
MTTLAIAKDKSHKLFLSKEYNFSFNMKSGFFARWGEKKEDDPLYSPFGPELFDIEIASGYCNGGCPWCYKGNTPTQHVDYMNLQTYRNLFDKIKVPTLTQIAFGITSIHANPDMWSIMEYTREFDVIPNYTTNGIGVTEEIAKRTKELCGAVAVSVYKHHQQEAYAAIRKYLDAGMDQVNIHFMLSKETLDFAYQVVYDMQTLPNLKRLHAIVFLQYKDKNPLSHFTQPTFIEFQNLVNHCLDKQIGFGFDSCSSAMFMKSVMDRQDADALIQSVDNCESSLFSFYINALGIGYPCSFLEEVGDWKTGIDVLKCNDFIKDVWYNEKTVSYRNKLLASSKQCNCKFSGSCRSCFVYDINDCKE